jgi:hypothetical protein
VGSFAAAFVAIVGYEIIANHLRVVWRNWTAEGVDHFIRGWPPHSVAW